MTIIRPVTDLDRDWPQIWPLFNEFLVYQAELAGSRLPAGREGATYKRLEKRVKGGRGLVVVAEEDGELRAIGEGRIENSVVQPGGKIGHFGTVVVRPDSRGTSLILKFLKWCEEWLRAQGITQAEMSVLVENNRAMHLWERLGYQPYGEIIRRRIRAEVLPAPQLGGEMVIDA